MKNKSIENKLNAIINLIKSINKKKGNTHVYVSSGVGGWGPPVRIGNRPEIVVINLHFSR